jgi:hypothetical protein
LPARQTRKAFTSPPPRLTETACKALTRSFGHEEGYKTRHLDNRAERGNRFADWDELESDNLGRPGVAALTENERETQLGRLPSCSALIRHVHCAQNPGHRRETKSTSSPPPPKLTRLT